MGRIVGPVQASELYDLLDSVASTQTTQKAKNTVISHLQSIRTVEHEVGMYEPWVLFVLVSILQFMFRLRGCLVCRSMQ